LRNFSDLNAEKLKTINNPKKSCSHFSKYEQDKSVQLLQVIAEQNYLLKFAELFAILSDPGR